MFRWIALALLLGAAVAIPYFYHRVDEQLRREIEARLRQQYPRLEVRVRSAHLAQGVGLEIRGVSLLAPSANGPSMELAYLDEIHVTCPTDWQDLLEGRLRISQVTVRRPTLRATRRADGTWSLAGLLPLPRLSDKPPTTIVEGGVLEILDPSQEHARRYSLREARLKIEPVQNGKRPRHQNRLLHVTGQATGDYLRRVEIDAYLDPGGKAWLASGTLEELELSPELLRSLPWEVDKLLPRTTSLRGVVKARFAIRLDTRVASALDFRVVGQLNRGTLFDSRLPYPLTDLRANFHCDRQGIAIEDLAARHGPATLRLSYQRDGLAADSRATLDAQCSRLRLDRKLLDALPESWKSHWYKFLPDGDVDLVEAHLEFDGESWHTDARIKCLNVAFTYHKFPYRLQRGRGMIELAQNRLSVDLAAYAGAEQLRIEGQVQAGQPQVGDWVEIRGDQLPIDDKLFDALPTKTSQVARALNARGTFNAFARFEWLPGDKPKLFKQITLSFSRCAVKYARFPYPVDNVRGRMRVEGDVWHFEDFSGTNDTGQITCRGKLAPGENGNELWLHFEGRTVPLEEELRDAFSIGTQHLWDDVRPRGAINLVAEVRCLPNERKPKVWVRAEPVESATVSSSIEPRAFPYRLEKLQGIFTYSDGRLEIAQLKARHARTTIEARGHCDLAQSGEWKLHLDQLAIDRLRVDHDLLEAARGRFKKTISALHPTGSLNLRGWLELQGGNQPNQAVKSAWDLQLDMQQVSLQCGLELQNVHGALRLAGTYDGQTFQSQGDFDVDSLTWKGFQFTDVHGPVWMDNDVVLLGQWADERRDRERQRHLTLSFYGGTAHSDGWIKLGDLPSYEFRIRLRGGDLKRFSSEALAGQRRLSGQVLATIDLRGKGTGTHQLGGRGTLELHDADLYELPQMLALLKLLRIRQPDSTAFTDSTIDFRVEGEHIYMDEVKFLGDAVSLLGKGEMNLNRELQLTLHAVVGRDNLRIPLVSPLLGGASQQIMLIHVDGTLDDPVLKSEAFPMVNKAVQQLQAELQNRGEAASRASQARSKSRGERR